MFGAFTPRHPKSSSPQEPWEDMKTISAVFTSSVIREGSARYIAVQWLPEVKAGKRSLQNCFVIAVAR